jgi:hypothetical protein
MANIIENRLEISFVDSVSRLAWADSHTAFEGGKLLLKYKENWSGDDCWSRILDHEETEDGAIVLYFDSKWSSPCSWFSEMVKANSNISQACFSYSDPNMLAVAELEWDGSDLAEVYREGNDLTSDDFFILGIDKCSKCSEYLCQCDAMEGIHDAL